uniref:Uncharacterized protein n=1 Tax=Ignavibacterium album TaxID=591197 RepID=A0A832DND3_9BACT
MKIEVQILPLLNNPDKETSVNKLVELSYKIAAQYLNFNFRRVNKILSSEELTLQELALDSIAKLFEYDSEIQLSQLFIAFRKWEPPVQNESDALKFLLKIVHSRVEQHISKLLRNSDPFFSKIMDWVNYAIKKNGYKKLSYLGTVYIVREDVTSISGKLITENDFNRIPLSVFSDKKNLIKNVLGYIEENLDYSPAVPLNQLIFRLKESSSSVFAVSESTIEQIEERDVESIVSSALEATFTKLSEYVTNGKISENEEIIFRKTLSDIVFDLRDGGMNKGLYKYFILNCDGLSMDVFQEKYQNKLEYLVRILKANIADELRH